MSLMTDEFFSVDENETKRYNADSTISFEGEPDLKLSASDVIRKAFADSGYSKASFGRVIGCTGQNISLRLSRNSITADEFIKWLDMLGYDVTITSRKTSRSIEDEEVDWNTRVRWTRCVVDGKKFNNRTAEVISNTFAVGTDGIFDENGHASELYKIADGTFILVDYSKEPGKDVVSTASQATAEAFIEKYGKTQR